MFKYQIMGLINRKPKPVTIALTSFRDLAKFIEQHAVEALDPDGKHGLSVKIVVHREADDLIYPQKPKTEAETDENDDLPC